MHALIIEDEAMVALAIEDVLRENGYTSFDFAVSVEEAVAAAEARCPDLITSDVMLKPGNGIDAIQTICGKSRVAVIFITGNASDVQRRLPTYRVIGKPFSKAEINAAIREAPRQLQR